MGGARGACCKTHLPPPATQRARPRTIVHLSVFPPPTSPSQAHSTYHRALAPRGTGPWGRVAPRWAPPHLANSHSLRVLERPATATLGHPPQSPTDRLGRGHQCDLLMTHCGPRTQVTRGRESRSGQRRDCRSPGDVVTNSPASACTAGAGSLPPCYLELRIFHRHTFEFILVKCPVH